MYGLSCSHGRRVSSESRLYIQVEVTSTNSNVQELIDITLEDKVSDRVCQCDSMIKESNFVHSTNRFLIVKVHPYTSDYLIKKPTCIKEIPTKTISITGRKYEFSSMLSHYGDLRRDQSHYVSMIKKKGQWLEISNDVVRTDKKCPKMPMIMTLKSQHICYSIVELNNYQTFS